MGVMTSSADRNLIYGVLALQMGFITRDALIAAMVACLADRARPIHEILREQAALAAEDHTAIEVVVRRFLEKNPDPAAGLTALDLEWIAPIQALASARGEADVRESLARLRTTPEDQLRTDPGATTAWGGPSSTEPNGDGVPPSLARLASSPNRYRIVRPHARGGLGEVFVAWDQELEREVALKEIREEHVHSQRLRERFVREAEINGNLEHPGIVPVYGLGTYPDGRPYYAMRFVQGETLQAALDRFHAEAPRLDDSQWLIGVRHLLRRFLSICDAVDYAHSRGVIHRDLKPANILLGKFGETLIIDWGLAKATGRADESVIGQAEREPTVPSPAPDSHVPTVVGETMGSPPYMSPEQARGDHSDLDSRSDFYSLGATMFAVITGRTPVFGRKTSEILERVGRGEIDPPSAVNPRVPLALEAICRKAMSLEPADRYPSARALADDLERWMEDRPVAVFEDPWSTRVLRWSRQHKSLVATALSLVAASFVGLIVIAVVVEQQKQGAERDRVRAVLAKQEAQVALAEAEEARKRARDHLGVGLDVVDHLVSFGDRQLITQMSAEDRTRFLGAASTFIRQFREREPGDLSIQVQTAQVARRLANLHRLIGKFDQADAFYDEAKAILDDLTKRSTDPTYADLKAETLIDQGEAWLNRGKTSDAERILQDAVTIARNHPKAGQDEGTNRRTLARGLNRLGSTHLVLGRGDAARLGQDALDAIQPVADAALPTARQEVLNGKILPLTDQLEVIQSHFTMAEGQDKAGRVGEAEAHLRLALSQAKDLLKRFEGVPIPDLDYFHAWIGTRLARLVMGQHGGDESLRLLEDALTRLGALVRKNGDLPHFRAALADAHAATAILHERYGRTDQARASAEAARATLGPLLESDREIPEYPNLMAEVAATLGRLAGKRGPEAQPEARAWFEEAVRNQQEAIKRSPEDVAYHKRLAEYEALRAASKPNPPGS